ncbi:MAG: agmatine/peptidylarginine deiminase [Planctomyces sp.]
MVSQKSDLTNYRWPAEWERHECTWVAWPVNPNTWPGIFERIPAAYSKMVAAIALFEPVNVLVGEGPASAEAARLIADACSEAGSRHAVTLVDIPVNDSWCRDHGPIFLTGIPGTSEAGQSVILDWKYNAWGGKYPPWDLDEQTASRIADRLNVPVVQPGWILEGGAVEGNGAGTMLTTESCLLNPNRNAGMTREQMETILRDYFQVQRIIWLPGHGILGDDTDGHIDQVARFVDERRVLVASPWNDDAPEAGDLRANRDALTSAKTADGVSLQPIELRMPSPKFQDDAQMPACYCNYYLANGGVIVPGFNDPADEVAMQVLQDCYPQHQVVKVDAIDLVWGLGAFHCMTQQQPAVSAKTA